MKKLKSFSEYLRSIGNEVPVKEKPMKELEESTLLSKGYALTQSTRHRTAAAKLQASIAKIQNLANKAKAEQNSTKKVNIIADMIAEHAQALKAQAEMSTSTNNVVVATNVLNQNTISHEK